MKETKITNKFEVVVNDMVFEFDDLKSAERKMRSLSKCEMDKNLLRKEIKNGKVLKTFLLE